jgi:3-hydroxybutyryl-CoA dehydrogenase
MVLDEIQHILIIGSGTMGQQIGLQAALYGYDVALYDIDPAALETAERRVGAYADGLVASGRIDRAQAGAALARMTYTDDPALAARDADLVSESVPENPELKAGVFAQFDELCPDRTIFTTNTSSLIPSLFAEGSGRPERLLAFHFHQMVWDSNVVDIMPHPGTQPELVPLMESFARSIGQVPIVLQKESYAYVFNAMLNALNTAALTLVANGVVPPETVDRAWMGVMKTGIGPFGILDLVGLDTVWHIIDYWANQTGDSQLRANADLVEGYMDEGRLGVKSGRGFYSYPDPAYARPDFLGGDLPDFPPA